MKSEVEHKVRVELWAEGQLYCYSNLSIPEGLTEDEGFDWALKTTLENGGSGFLIQILPAKIAAKRSGRY